MLSAYDQCLVEMELKFDPFYFVENFKTKQFSSTVKDRSKNVNPTTLPILL